MLIEENSKEIKPKKVKESTTIGIDLGIKDFAVLSTGEKIDNPKYLKTSIQRLNVLQRRMSRKQKGSKNRAKARNAVSKLHEKISNQRNDFQHKLSSKIVNDNQVIISEDLMIANMVKNHKLAKAIQDVSWGEFTKQLKYKSEWNCKIYHKISPWFASSQIWA